LLRCTWELHLGRGIAKLAVIRSIFSVVLKLQFWATCCRARRGIISSILDTTQVHGKPPRTSGFLLHEQPHRRSDARTSDALTDWNQDRCVSLGLCARRVWLILFAVQICDICRSDLTCVHFRIYILYHRCSGQHLSLYVRTCDCLSYIYAVCLYSYNGFSSYMIYLQSVFILFVERAVREAAGLSAQWPFTSVMLVIPVFLFLSAPQ